MHVKRLRNVFLLMVAALVASMALPATTAFADDKVPVGCDLTLQIVYPGDDVVKVKKNHIDVKNSDQVAMGWLECRDSSGVPVPELSGVVTTNHGSKIKVDMATGDFKGKLKGSLSLTTADGYETLAKFKATVSGMMVYPGDPSTVVGETIGGKLKLKGMEIKFKGNFDISLVPSQFVDATGTPVWLAIVGSGPEFLVDGADNLILVVEGDVAGVPTLYALDGTLLGPTAGVAWGGLAPVITLAGIGSFSGVMHSHGG